MGVVRLIFGGIAAEYQTHHALSFKICYCRKRFSLAVSNRNAALFCALQGPIGRSSNNDLRMPVPCSSSPGIPPALLRIAPEIGVELRESFAWVDEQLSVG
jgi:hypothetical protein